MENKAGLAPPPSSRYSLRAKDPCNCCLEANDEVGDEAAVMEGEEGIDIGEDKVEDMVVDAEFGERSDIVEQYCFELLLPLLPLQVVVPLEALPLQ